MNLKMYLKKRRNSREIEIMDMIANHMMANTDNGVVEKVKTNIKSKALRAGRSNFAYVVDGYEAEYQEIFDKTITMSTWEEGLEVGKMIKKLSETMKEEVPHFRGIQFTNFYITNNEMLVFIGIVFLSSIIFYALR